jgi:hypothetical protein
MVGTGPDAGADACFRPGTVASIRPGPGADGRVRGRGRLAESATAHPAAACTPSATRVACAAVRAAAVGLAFSAPGANRPDPHRCHPHQPDAPL